jgi:hypothetical protein
MQLFKLYARRLDSVQEKSDYENYEERGTSEHASQVLSTKATVRNGDA